MLMFGGKRWNLKCEPRLYIRFHFQTPTSESPLSYVTPLALLASTCPPRSILCVAFSRARRLRPLRDKHGAVRLSLCINSYALEF